MRALKPVLVLAALAVVMAPEIVRYRGERSLYRLTALAQSLPRQPLSEVERLSAIAEVSRAAERLTTYPADWRPVQLSGVAALFAKNPQRAIEMLSSTSRLGERPEVDVDLGLAYAALNRRVDADAAMLRAAWVSPAVVKQLEQQTGARFGARVEALEAKLHSGRLRQSDLPPRPGL
jgi:hypothetical protein